MTDHSNERPFREAVEGIAEARRDFMKSMALAGGAVAAGGVATVAAPHVANAQAQKTYPDPEFLAAGHDRVSHLRETGAAAWST